MEKIVRTTEREYTKKMAELNRGFEVSLRLYCVVSAHPCIAVSWTIFLRYGDEDDGSRTHGDSNW